jgi:hypothetical protein
MKLLFSRYRPEQALGGSGRLRLRIFITFGTMKVVWSSALRTGRLYLQEFSWYSFLETESTPGHMVPSVATEIFAVTPLGIDPEILRLIKQRLNHYATPGPVDMKSGNMFCTILNFSYGNNFVCCEIII